MALESKAENNVITDLASHVPLPKMLRVRQLLDRSHYEPADIPGIVRQQMLDAHIQDNIRPGMTIAVTCGSRGVANIALITRAIVDFVKECGGKPFVFPAMGSHGGATREGQMQILEGYGVTEETMGCPVRATMETVQVGTAEVVRSPIHSTRTIPVYTDKYAHEADGIILCNRVKAHTAFRGDFESGIMKMSVIGMGKQKGAELVHQDGFFDMGTNLPIIGKTVLENNNIVGAVATVENAFDQTCRIEAMQAEEIWTREPELLKYSKTRLGRIYFNPIDVLVVDQIGKDISGDGMDPNVSGRWAVPYIKGDLDAQRVAVLSLTEETHGNCNGLGLADITTKRCVDQVDVDCTYPNVFTSTVVCTPKIPMFGHSDRTAIAMALHTCNFIDQQHPRIVRIKDTMRLEYIEISEALLEEAENNPNIEVLEEPRDWKFDENGNLFGEHSDFC